MSHAPLSGASQPPWPAAAAGRATRGYVTIGDYAAIGDGRTVALVARDGSIDWLCLPDLDSPSVFAAVLDADRGGRFELVTDVPAQARRRFLPGTNVLETTFTSAQGVVRVTDAMTLPNSDLGPTRELIRRVDGVEGRVPMRWRITPAFGYATVPPRIGRRGRIPVAVGGRDALAVCSWEAGEAQIDDEAISGHFEARASSSALIALCAAHQEPLVFPAREHVERRLDATTADWRRWAAQRSYDGPWRDAVIRSALALKLLFHAPSGAIAAAATASLPEEIGGERNWDYRFCWIRDSSFTLDALLHLGCPGEAEAFFWWLLDASQLTHPHLQVLYRLDGGERAPERTLLLDGYRGSRPVRVGNDAAEQTQLDIYGDLLQTALIYTEAGGQLDRETRCWSERLDSYTRQAGGEELDASLLLGVLFGYESPNPGRLSATVNALRRDLGHGPLLSRYSGEDGLRGGEGAFLCCSFWLADALARIGDVDAASELMEQLIALANDVGLYAEELDPVSNELLGNTPQGLVHLALINAAVSIAKASAT
jgi:GH15 family glucan-1,4-alpha-glucosidase